MRQTAGMLLFLAGAFIVMGIITAEIFYPAGYSISKNMISTLGSTPPPNSVIDEPSAAIFDNAIKVAGLLIIIAVLSLREALKSKIFIISAVLMGAGLFGVGIFPAFHPLAHPISALIAFLFGGISAILSLKVTTAPFKYISAVLGLITLIFLFLGIILPGIIVPILGVGGTERWVAYPLILWLTAFGGYLMSSRKHLSKRPGMIDL